MTFEIAPHEVISGCRSCGSNNLADVLDLGTTPLADRLLTEDMLDEQEFGCPLSVVFCEDCALMQIRETVDPVILFGGDYPYYSSVSPALLKHFRESTEEIMTRRKLGADNLVIEIASNDGYLLKNYADKGIRILGIDPASGPAEKAIEQGIDTRIEFFTLDYAKQLARENYLADVVHANNVLAHVADTNGFVAGMAAILKDDGEAVIECPYLKPLIDECEFDTIYHQHLCYFSLTSLDALFRRHGLYLNRVVLTSIHGGSLRLFLEKTERREASVLDALAAERQSGMTTTAYYAAFADRVHNLAKSLRHMLVEIHERAETIAGYGAAAKACTLMSYVGIDDRYLDYIADRSTFKQGRYMTGNHLPIVPPERILSDMPDYVLILSWNFVDEIVEQQSEYRRGGGKFIVPVPEPGII